MFPSGTRLPAVDRVLSLSLARSVAREISVDLGKADGAAKKERRGLEGWRRIPALWTRYVDWLHQHRS